MLTAFDEIQLGNMLCANRIIRSATNDYAGNEDGTVSDAQKKIYQELAQGQIGLIISGHIAIRPEGRNDIHQNALWNDSFIASQRVIPEIVHQYGGKIIAQLNHSGAKAQEKAIQGAVPIAPSAITLAPGAPARAMEQSEIVHTEEAFAAAALRAQQAGYDGIQLHCAHGYLLSQFIDGAWNHREDQYGGSQNNRFRMAEETLQKIRKVVGQDYPILLKLHGNDIADTKEHRQALYAFLRRAKEHGVAAVEISGPDFAVKKPADRLYYLANAVAVRRETGLLVALVGGIRSQEDMQRALNAGIDMVSMSRPFICQPDIIPRLQNGEISKCINCFGCFSCYQKAGKRCVLHTDA